MTKICTKKVDYRTWHPEFSIKVLSHPTNGRYIVATEDLEAQTVILRDLPYTWAVDYTSKGSVCQQCFLEVPLEMQVQGANDEPAQEFHMCDVCQFVGYCSQECKAIDAPQHQLECTIFKNFELDEYSTSLISEVKLLIRTLSRKWLEQSLPAEEEHASYAKYRDATTTIPQENGLRYSDYDQLVSNICNAFYIQGRPKGGGNGESRGCGVYVRNSFFNHSCDPNVNYWVVDNTLEVECSLMRGVKTGEELCISYIDAAAALKDRQEKLLEGYLFNCRCDKCIRDEFEQNNPSSSSSAIAPATTPNEAAAVVETSDEAAGEEVEETNE
eukprot:gene12049-14097_t